MSTWRNSIDALSRVANRMLGAPSLTAKAMLIGERVQNFRCRQPEGSGLRRPVRFALNSPLEEAGFEPSVPRKTPAVVVISGLVAPPSPLRQAEPTRAPLSKPWSSHAVLTVRSGLFQR